ncbi:Smg-4/UPF3 family-domain-containing protein [Pilobolus umbonatus]|nr:Smg-4/UPF3 family-domain-containing protein [Pilobolus umbonatus]
MSSDTPKVDTKPEKSKRKKRDRPKKKKRYSRKSKLKTKVVVRRLPPNLPEQVFMNSVKPWVTEESVDYSLFVPGKLSKSKAKESVFSRAYFHFKTMEAVIAFHQGYDGHVFVDSQGNEGRAVVEFAPYQKVPKESKVTNSRQGTIDQDQDYLDFVESLKAEAEDPLDQKNDNADGLTQIERLENRIAMVTAQTLAAELANKPKTTPLLDHLRALKAAQAAIKPKKNNNGSNSRRRNNNNNNNKPEQTPPTEQKKPRRDRTRRKKEDKKETADKPTEKPADKPADKPKEGRTRRKKTDSPSKPRPTVKILDRPPTK